MSEFTSLENVKSWLQLTTDTADGELSRLIRAASAFIETKLSRRLLIQEYSETYNGPGGFLLPLRNTPIAEVASLRVGGVSIRRASDGSAAPSGYRFDQAAVYLVGGAQFERGVQNVSVVYTAGYTEVPADIEQVTIELVGQKFKEKGRIGEQSKSLAGQAMTFRDGDLTQGQRDVLSSYARKAPIL